MEPAGHTARGARGGGRGTATGRIVLVGVLALAELATGEVTVCRRDSVDTSRRHDPSDTVRTIWADPVRRTRVATPARSDEEPASASRHRHPGPRVITIHRDDREDERSHPEPIATRLAPVRTIMAGRDELAAGGRSCAARRNDSHEVHDTPHVETGYPHGPPRFTRSHRYLGDRQRGSRVSYVATHHAYPSYGRHFGACYDHYGHHRYRRSHYRHRGHYHGDHYGGAGFHIYIRF